jgi:hypothetical protein
VAPTPPSLFMARRQLSELHLRSAWRVSFVTAVLELELELDLDVVVGDGLMELKLIVELP